MLHPNEDPSVLSQFAEAVERTNGAEANAMN